MARQVYKAHNREKWYVVETDGTTTMVSWGITEEDAIKNFDEYKMECSEIKNAAVSINKQQAL